MAEHGTFSWNEFEIPDQQRAGKFHGGLLGWTRHAVDAGPFEVYSVFRHHDKDVAGMTSPTTDITRARGPAWNAYVAVDDVDECAARVEGLGGTLVAPPHDVPDVGRVCMIADPTGATLLLMTPVAAITLA